jgi:pimeloyl-ACP methyl ester carboxylesterase
LPALARFSFLLVLLPVLALPLTAAETPAENAAIGRSQQTPSAIVVGFVGGFVRHDNPYHGPVILSKRLQDDTLKGAFVRVYENRHRRTAFETILHLLDRNHDGKLSDEEKAQARIVLFGHSWGGSAVVLLARDLQRVGIPVLLTVQVDSVAKPWQKDSIVPENVAAAVNFYQPHGIIKGRPQIVAADPSKTQILGNFRYDYKKEPVQCSNLSWYDRFITPGHARSECDPHLWTRVEDLVKQSLAPAAGVVAAAPLSMQ